MGQWVMGQTGHQMGQWITGQIGNQMGQRVRWVTKWVSVSWVR